MLNTANIYIDLLNKIKESGGAVPPELVEEVEALDVTVNGDETTEPPTVGLVDIVADLGDEVEDLDIDINGDDTTEPPTPGLKDRTASLEIDINGDDTTEPPTPGLKDRTASLESAITDGVTVATVTADGVKTYSALLDELYSASNAMSETDILYSRLIIGGANYFMSMARNRYGSVQCDSSGNVGSYGIAIRNSGSFYRYATFSGTSVTTGDNGPVVPASGTVFKIVKL